MPSDFATIDNGVQALQAFAPMRDGVELDTFVYLQSNGGPAFPVIVQRTPNGITEPPGEHVTDPRFGWQPDPEEPMQAPSAPPAARFTTARRSRLTSTSND